MNNKLISLLIVLGIYVVAIAGGGFFIYFMQPYFASDILLVFTADVIATLIVFVFSLIFKNASVYDPYWSVVPPMLILSFYYLGAAKFDVSHLIILIPFLLWAIRLTANWCVEFANLKWQDWRYTRYKDKFPKIYPLINLNGVMLVPTILVFAGTVPFYYLITGAANLTALINGGVIVLIAVTIQTISDIQMKKFRNNSENKGKCIDVGLWKYSRHPNYFGEILIWLGVFVASVPNVNVFSWIGFVAILLLFIFVSVPLLENKLQKSRPEAFMQYKKEVPSALVPFINKKQK